MGEPKGLVEIHGRAWLEVQLDAIERAGGRGIVVLGADREQFFEALPDLAGRVRVAFNDDPDRGPFSSLQCGLALAEPGAPAFVLPVDVPAASPEVWHALQDRLTAGVDAVVPELEGRGGHPVLLAGPTVGRLRAQPATSRLDAELKALPNVLRIPVKDPSVRLNLNAPRDWVKLEQGK